MAGSLIRTEATGYGVVYILNELMNMTTTILLTEKLLLLQVPVMLQSMHKPPVGVEVIAMCDSNGYP